MINLLVIIYIYFTNILKILLNYQAILTTLLRKNNFQCMYINIKSIDFFPNSFANQKRSNLYLILSRYLLTAPIVERKAGSREMFIAIGDNYAAEREDTT